VVNVDRGRYGCRLAEDRMVTAMKARELGRNSVVVGDRVALAGDISGAPGTLARIVRVFERTSVLRRSPDDSDPLERIIVANAQQMVIVSSLADPPPRLRFIDRCLVAAYDAGLDPLLVLTKADLASPRTIRASYKPLGLPILTTRLPLPPQTLSRLRRTLTGRVSVLIGQSGVGKSTLMNALIPEADRAVGTVNPVTGRGRHTSSSAVALRLPPWRGASSARPDTARPDTIQLDAVQPDTTQSDTVQSDTVQSDTVQSDAVRPDALRPDALRPDILRPDVVRSDPGWLIDTPGVRGFGLGHVSAQRVVEAFGDLAEGTVNCPPGCDHLSPDCALDEWATAQHAEARLDSLRRLLRSRTSAPD
jgi:ribosome biogenesis GTPase / thiamine phosphate phosphatase